MNYEGLPLYNISIDELNNEDGVSVMSLVESPAVEKEFLKFSKQKKIDFSLNEEKRVVTGVAIRADYPILRSDENGNWYYVTFSKECIEKIVLKFMAEKRTSEVNEEHGNDVEDVFLFESFILKKGHFVKYPGFDDVSEGSWIVSYKVNNDEIWNKIKSGQLNGFSIEMNASLSKDFKKEKHDIDFKTIYQLINILNG